MTASPAPPPQRRPGGRSARVQAAVFAATLDELRDTGYDALSVATVAARSGVHETSIYRRWGTKAALVRDTLLAFAAHAVPTPDTGTLQGDLHALLREVAAFMQSPEGAAGVQLAVAAGSDGEMAAVRRAYWADRFSRAETVIQRGVTRGELPPGVNSRLFLETLIGVVYVRVFLTGESVDEETIAGVIALVLHGVA